MRRARAASLQLNLRSPSSSLSKSSTPPIPFGRRITSASFSPGIARTSKIYMSRTRTAAACPSRSHRSPKAESPMPSGARMAKAFILCTKAICGRFLPQEAKRNPRGASPIPATDSPLPRTASVSRSSEAIAPKIRPREKAATSSSAGSPMEPSPRLPTTT